MYIYVDVLVHVNTECTTLRSVANKNKIVFHGNLGDIYLAVITIYPIFPIFNGTLVLFLLIWNCMLMAMFSLQKGVTV